MLNCKLKISISAMLLVLSLFTAACSSNTSKVDSDTTNDSVTDETITETVTTEDLYTDLGSYDFDGQTFTIAYHENQIGAMWPYEAEEENGNIVNDSVWKRDILIEEKYNTDVIWYDHSNQGIAKLLETTVLAGDTSYQLGIGHMFEGINSLVASGGLYDFNDLPIIDFEKPWWAQHLVDTLSVDGILLLHVSDLVYTFADCIYFNKDMIKDYGTLPDPYELVYDGSWTWTKLTEMAKSVSIDLDGNGIFDDKDQYGFTLSNNTWTDANWIYSNGMTIAHIEDGVISLDTVMSERMVKTIEMMHDLVHNGNQTYIRKEGSGAGEIEDLRLLLNGQALFHENITTLLPEMRDTDIDFGIVPLPKFDEAQDDYYSEATTQMMMVPSNIENPEFIGLMLEALSMESYRIVRPAVYETSFSEKYLRDDESYDMFNIIRNSGVYDFNWNFGSGNKFVRLMSILVRDDAPNTLSSFYESNKDAVLSTLQSVIDSIKAIDNY